MDGKIKKILIELLPVLLPLACLLLSSCSFDEDLTCSEEAGGTATVVIHITANGLGDLNATRSGDDEIDGTEDGDEGEYMHSLCIFIVDDNTGKIVKKLNSLDDEDDDDDIELGDDAADGNLQEYTCDVELETDLNLGNGSKKTIYAFSNWEGMDCDYDAWNTLIAKDVGDEIDPETDLNFTITDPASKIDIDNVDPESRVYIPMSGKTTFKMSSGTNQISVDLDRLVGKVRVTIDGNEEKEVTLSSLTFSGYATKVPLFPSESDSYTTTENTKTKTATLLSTSVASNASGQKIAEFYVNETYRSTETDVTGFTVDLTLDAAEEGGEYGKYDGTEYSSTTERMYIPRNYIYPIKISLDQYKPEFDLVAYTSGIGGGVVEYIKGSYVEDVLTPKSWYEGENEKTTEWDKDYYYFYVTLLEVTQRLELYPTMYSSVSIDGITETTDDGDYENKISNDVITWTVTNEDDNTQELSISDWADNTDGEITFTDFTASSSTIYNLTLTAKWTDTSNDVPQLHSRTYNLVFDLGYNSSYILDTNGDGIDGSSDDIQFNIKSSRWTLGTSERLNMTIRSNFEQNTKEGNRL